MTTDQTTDTTTSRATDVAWSLTRFTLRLLLIAYIAKETAALWDIDVTLKQAFFTLGLAFVAGPMITGREV